MTSLAHFRSGCPWVRQDKTNRTHRTDRTVLWDVWVLFVVPPVKSDLIETPLEMSPIRKSPGLRPLRIRMVAREGRA